MMGHGAMGPWALTFDVAVFCTANLVSKTLQNPAGNKIPREPSSIIESMSIVIDRVMSCLYLPGWCQVAARIALAPSLDFDQPHSLVSRLCGKVMFESLVFKCL